MGIATKHLSSDDLARIAGEILTQPKTTGRETWAHCPWHTESSPGGAFSYNFQTDKAFCNSCGQAGDLISVFSQVEGLSDKDGFLEFCRRYCPQALHKKEGRSSRPARTPELRRRDPRGEILEAEQVTDPVELWQQKAGQLVEWSHGCLLRDQAILDWLESRGINRETAIRFRLGWNPGEKGKDIFRERPSWGLPVERKDNGQAKKLWIPKGLVIPNFNPDGRLQRVRIRRPEGEPKYFVLPGSAHDPMPCLVIPSTWPGRFQALVTIEAELDALALSQAAGDLVQVLSLGSASAKPRDAAAHETCDQAAVILYAGDFDQAGDKALQWWLTHYPQVKDIRLQEHKDPGEAFKAGVDLRQWILDHLPPAWTIAQKYPGPSKEKTPDRSQEESQGESRPELQAPESVRRLGEILEQEPIELVLGLEAISCTPKKLKNGKWVESSEWWHQNQELGAELQRLFWYDPEIEAYLRDHPDGVITRENFWKGLTG